MQVLDFLLTFIFRAIFMAFYCLLMAPFVLGFLWIIFEVVRLIFFVP